MTTRKKLLIYKVLLFLFAFFIAFMPSTALRNKEVNSRVIVGILGLDGGEKVSLTAQYVMPTEAQGSTGKDTVTVEGDTLDEAAEALNTALGRRVELGHCSMVIVGKDAKPELLGSLMTATDVTADVWMAAADGKAEDLIADLTEFMSKTGATDADFIAYSARKAHIATNTLLGFLSDLGSASKTAYMPLVEMQSGKASESGDSGSGGGSGGGEGGDSGSSGGESGSGGEGEQKTGMKVEKLALYDESGRVGVLDSTSARGVAWVSAPVEKGTVCSDVEFNGKTIKGVCGRLLKKHSSVKVDQKMGIATIKIKAFIEPHGDKFNSLFATNSSKANEALIAGYKKKIQGEVESAFSNSLASNSDPLFIGREFYRHCPDYYKSQYDYNNIKIKYEIEISLK
ncbi:MAG: hypothetical protein K2M47_05705 [Clostridiales bacterium]|nr:hypothetical protein [Clostridiales bacterium]